MSIYGRRFYTKTVYTLMTPCTGPFAGGSSSKLRHRPEHLRFHTNGYPPKKEYKFLWKFVRLINFSRKITSCFCSQNFAEKARAFTILTTQNEILFREIHLNSLIAAIHNYIYPSMQYSIKKSDSTN